MWAVFQSGAECSLTESGAYQVGFAVRLFWSGVIRMKNRYLAAYCFPEFQTLGFVGGIYFMIYNMTSRFQRRILVFTVENRTNKAKT